MAANPPPPPNCPALGPPGHIVRSRLIARDTARADVGPYTVTLPGYATDPADATRDSYAPFLIEAKPGDTLRFDLVNQLTGEPHPQDHTNLHTHGLLVAPRPDKPCGPPGDYVFVDEAAPGLVQYRIDIPATLPGQEFGTGTSPQAYPPGLLWFHAHLHGAAKNQVMAGESGLLAIGHPLDGLQAAGTDPSSLVKLKASTDVKYLALRDIQLAVPKGATPDKLDTLPPHPAATWLSGDDYDSGACSASPPSPQAKGWCSHAGTTVGGQTDAARDTVWLFTVNGQLFPQITLPDRRNQVWRIANLSANVTYVLELVEDSTGAEQPMRVLTIDGVVAGHPGNGAGTPYDVPGVELKRLLLMPASRAEVFISNEARTERNLTLRTRGIQTGPKLDDTGAPVGDPWPALALAHVHWLPQPAAAMASAPPISSWAEIQSLRLPRPQAALSGDLQRPAMQALLLAPRPGPGSPPAPSPVIPAGCITLPGASGGKSYRRQISFEQDATSFKLGSTVVDQDGHELDPAHRIPAVAYPPPSAAPPSDHSWPNPTQWVCAHFGAQETWELVNNTDEMHNFHIHQSKFRLARQGDIGIPSDLVAPESSTCAGPGTPVVCDPFPVLGEAIVEWPGATPTPGVDVWHDTIPVPPRSADGATPGRVFVSIPFKAPAQIGRFVFHCHILEHEDGGMMAPVEVLHPDFAVAQAAPSPTGGAMAMAHHH